MTLPEDNQNPHVPPFEQPEIPEAVPPAAPQPVTPLPAEVEPAPVTPEPEVPARPRRRMRGSVMFPLILITIGVIVLLNNLGVITGNIWDQLVPLWPLILIAIGLDDLIRGDGAAGPVFWIGLGAVFLLLNLGVFEWDAFKVILNLWPLLIVAVGLDLLIGRRSRAGGWIAAILMLAILAVSLWYVGINTSPTGGLPAQSIQQEAAEATRADIQLSPPVGTVTVKAGPADLLLQGEIRVPRNLTVHQNYQVVNGLGEYDLDTEGEGFGTISSPLSWMWNLEINPSYPVTIETDMGMGDLTLDLTGLQVNGLQSDFGIGRVEATLPQEGNFRGQINGAMGIATLRVPRGLPVRVETDGLIIAHDAPDDFTRAGNYLTSPSYAGSADKVDIKVSLVFARLVVEYID